VVGRDFEHRLLAALTEYGEEALLRLIEEALAARAIEETERVGEYRFTHALMHETLLGELSSARPVLLHGQIADALLQLHGEATEAHAPELAGHHAESAALNRAHVPAAVHFPRLAGERALAALAYDEAVRQYSRALALLDHSELPLERARLQLALGRALIGVPNVTEGSSLIIEAYDVFERFDAAREMGEAVLAAVLASTPGGAEAQGMAERALRALHDSDAWLKAQVALVRSGGLNVTTWTEDETPEEAAAADEVRRLAALAGLEDVKARMLLRDGALALRTDHDRARALFAEAEASGSDLDDS